MADVPDDIFGQNDIGESCGIRPEGGQLVSPVGGTIATASLGEHTTVITSDDGMHVLVHVGSDENDTGEKTARLLVNAEQHIAVGDPLMSFTNEADGAQQHNRFVIIAILNSGDFASINILQRGHRCGRQDARGRG